MTLFGEPDEAPATATGIPRPKWTAIQAGRCDQCVRLASAHRLAGSIQPARWRRVCGPDDARLCYGHARTLRDVDDTVIERLNREAG